MLTRSDGSEIYIVWSFHDEEGDHFDAWDYSWDIFSEMRESHTAQLLFTKKKIGKLSLYPDPNSVATHLVPPSTRPFFSFARLTTNITGNTFWLYSAFGYELDDGSLFYLKAYTDYSTIVRILAPDEPFPL